MRRYIPCAACWWLKAPQALGVSTQLRPMHKPPLASDGIYRQGRTPRRSRPRRARGCRRAVPPSRPGSWWFSALFAEGRQRERSAQVIPGRSPFGSLLLVDHRLSGLCPFTTNEPSANVYLGGKTTLYTIHLTRACLKNIRHTEMPKGGIPWASLIIPAQKMLRRLSPGGLTRPDRPCAPGRLPSAPRRCRRGRSDPSPARRPGRLRSGPPGRSAPPAIWWCRRRGAP
jgi:hypothetical protein